MAARSERRSRRSSGAVAQTPADTQLPAECFFKGPMPGGDSLLEQLLGGIPSPVRTHPGAKQIGNGQLHGIPCSPPAHSPTLLSTQAVATPPPPQVPAPGDRETAGLSYREKLRAGGRGAFQRAYDVGLMPRTMKPEWPSAEAQSYFPQQTDVQSSMAMSCPAGNDAQLWGGTGQVQNNDYWDWGASMEHAQMSTPMDQLQWNASNGTVPYMQQVPMVQLPQSPELLHMTPMPGQQSPLPIAPQALMQPAQMPQVAVQVSPQEQFPLSTCMGGDATPTDIERCMAIIMPPSSQLLCDKDLMAAQLKAAADCQCYED